MSIWDRKKPSFGFVSTRLAGTDGVSLEAAKWVDLLTSKGCQCFFMAGELDTDPNLSHLVPEAFFQHQAIKEVQHALFTEQKRTRELTRRIHELKETIKVGLEEFHCRFEFDIMVVQNALSIPVNIPLGLAITEFIMENEIATIAHHHDFYWERQRFNSFSAIDYLRWAFPPVYPSIRHVVINSIAGAELSLRTGASWTLIPNVLDFKTLPPGIDDYTRGLRNEIGLRDGQLLVLQPTRVVSRKGIETAIELVRRLNTFNYTLVITHKAGDEGLEYLRWIEDYADSMGVELRFIADRIQEKRCYDEKGRKKYTLWDVYPHADLVTYPSTYEGFGNAFVEAIYFRKPVIVNRYAIFEADIEPKGFDVIAFTDFFTESTVNDIRSLLNDRQRREQMAEKNYMLGWQYFSYEMLEEKLESILAEILGS